MPINTDAWLTLRLFRLSCLGRKRNSAGLGRIPILMYHSVSDKSSGHSHPYFETNTTPGRFSEQIRFLADRGYRSLTMSEAADMLQAEETTAERTVAITFDDGYEDFLTDAWPVLDKAGMTATVFVPTAFIDSSSSRMEGRQCLGWEQVRTLTRAGVEFGSHTVNHPQLTQVTCEKRIAEIEQSKRRIEAETDGTCRGFSYPYAFPGANRDFCMELRRTLVEVGYAWGVTTTIATAGRKHDGYTLPRLPVNERDTPALLEAKLSGAYDWLGHLQGFTKSVRAMLHRGSTS